MGARLAALSEATATVTSKNLRNMAASSFGLLWLRAAEQGGRHLGHAIILLAGHSLHWTVVQYLAVKGRPYYERAVASAYAQVTLLAVHALGRRVLLREFGGR